MTLSPLAAHAACLALVGLDMLARAVRTRMMLRACGRALPVGRVLEFNLWAEAAAALSPFRLAGEPARVGGMLHAGVPLNAALITSATEGAVNWLAALLVGLGIIVGFAPAWWHEAGPAFLAHAAAALPVVLVVLLAVVGGAWFLHRRLGHRMRGRWRDRVRELFRLWAGLPPGVLLAGLILSVFSVAARTVLLPVLALAAPGHPGFGVGWVGSFMLVYSQVALPVPAGAGAVELAFLGGIAGEPGSGSTTLLVAWRAYSLGLATAVGAALAIHRFGARPLWQILRARRAARGPGPAPAPADGA